MVTSIRICRYHNLTIEVIENIQALFIEVHNVQISFKHEFSCLKGARTFIFLPIKKSSDQ